MSTKSISYETAMTELCDMFPDIDREVIKMVLKELHGHMERTIDQLLVIRGEAPINTPTAVPPQQQTPNSPADSPAPTQPARGPIPVIPQQTVEQQIASDEALAREIQRRLAIKDMMAMDALREQGIDIPTHRPAAATRQVVSAYGEAAGAEDELISMKEIKDKLDKLSGAAKLKLREVWAKLKPKPQDPANATGAGVDLQLVRPVKKPSADPEKQSLIGAPEPDDDDEEVAFDSSLSRRLKPVGDNAAAATNASSVLEFEQSSLAPPTAAPPQQQQASVVGSGGARARDLIQLDDLGLFGVSTTAPQAAAAAPQNQAAAPSFPGAAFGVVSTSAPATAQISSSSSTTAASRHQRTSSPETKKDL